MAEMNDGLPQGSVLAPPTLFNLYMSDLPKTEDTIFQFADGIAISYQSMEMVDGERVLTNDITLNTYFQQWRLKLNPNKTEVCAFHLNKKQASKTLNIRFDHVQLNHNFTPKYLSITLNCNTPPRLI